VDGCPPGMPLTEADIQPQMTRRRPGQSALTTPRDEKDKVQIQSGTEFGVTLGTPIGMLVLNENQRPKDYGNSTMDLYPRPSHADFTYLEKYGVKASSGGGRSSARETIGMSPTCIYRMSSPLMTYLCSIRPSSSWRHSRKVFDTLP
jgi:chorismate synthase